MAKSEAPQAPTEIARVLDWKGAATNAMALIAPGAFLWITYQAQVGLTVPSGASSANDMWAGILVALGLALLTALSYAELAKIYPEAGFAGCVYFAEKAFIDDQKLKRPGPQSMARIAKLITGWAAHLFYWVYPGVMVAFMGTLASYVYGAITGGTMTIMWELVIAWVFAFGVGYIAYKGVAWFHGGKYVGQHHPMGNADDLQRIGYRLPVDQSGSRHQLGLQRRVRHCEVSLGNRGYWCKRPLPS